MFGPLRPQDPLTRAQNIISRAGGKFQSLPFSMEKGSVYIIYGDSPLKGQVIAFTSEKNEIWATQKLRDAFVNNDGPLVRKRIDRSFARLHSIITGPVFNERGIMVDLHSGPLPEDGFGLYVGELGHAQRYEAWLPRPTNNAFKLDRLYQESFGVGVEFYIIQQP